MGLAGPPWFSDRITKFVFCCDSLMRTVIVAFCLLATVQLRADMKVKDYKRILASSDQGGIAFTKMFVNGLGDGISTANTMTGNRLFCPPDNLGLVLGNYTDILEKQIAEIDKDDAKYEEIPIGILLIRGLAETFPCPKPAKTSKK